MKIKDKIRLLQKRIKTERYVFIHYANAENHSENTGFFMSDLKTHLANELASEELLDKEIAVESRYIRDGIKCISFGYE